MSEEKEEKPKATYVLKAETGKIGMAGRCPTCGSRAPHLHPADSFSRQQVQPCRDDFHKRVTPENTPEMIADVQEFFRKTDIQKKDAIVSDLDLKRKDVPIEEFLKKYKKDK